MHVGNMFDNNSSRLCCLNKPSLANDGSKIKPNTTQWSFRLVVLWPTTDILSMVTGELHFFPCDGLDGVLPAQ